MLIEDALARFLTQLQADGRSIHTRKQYARHIRLLARWTRDVAPCGDEIERLGHEDVASFLSAPVATGCLRGGQKLATSSNCLRSSLKGFFSYLHRAGYIPLDPGRMVRRAVCGTPPPRALSDDEQARLLDALTKGEGPEAERDHVIIHLMLAAGLRLGSALALDIEDVDFERAEVHLRSAKGNRPDRVFLGTQIKDHLARYIAERRSGILFPSKAGTRVSQRHMQRRFAMWVAKAGIRRAASSHACRHTFATKLYARTGDVLLVMRAMNHRSVASTLVYAKVSDERLRQVV